MTELVDIHFADANAKLAFIAKYLPELKNDSNLRAEIEKLAQVIDENTNAVNNNTEVTEQGIEELKGVNAKLDKILEKLDKLIDLQTCGRLQTLKKKLRLRIHSHIFLVL